MHFTICDFILDILQNSLEAGAGRIDLELYSDSEIHTVSVRDDGRGMNEDELRRLSDPYTTDGKKHENRQVGLGIPFLVQAVEQCGGTFRIDSKPGDGTVIGFSFPSGHLDTPPYGDIADLLLQSFIFEGEYELIVRRRLKTENGEDGYSVSRSECRDALGSLYDGTSLKLLRSFLRSQEDSLEPKQIMNR